jgi:hypothetical protein
MNQRQEHYHADICAPVVERSSLQGWPEECFALLQAGLY